MMMSHRSAISVVGVILFALTFADGAYQEGITYKGIGFDSENGNIKSIDDVVEFAKKLNEKGEFTSDMKMPDYFGEFAHTDTDGGSKILKYTFDTTNEDDMDTSYTGRGLIAPILDYRTHPTKSLLAGNGAKGYSGGWMGDGTDDSGDMEFGGVTYWTNIDGIPKDWVIGVWTTYQSSGYAFELDIPESDPIADEINSSIFKEMQNGSENGSDDGKK